ncbi:MAG: cytochrome c-type biogenesis protein CcmH [Bauldia sp.]|nr:cytochrome c-type biogenesis protein CcmH [Bauldia sp.]
MSSRRRSSAVRRVVAALALFVGLAAGPAYAVLPDEMLDDPVLEERARNLSAELRCMVCQNNSIDESTAEIARDLRVLLRERIVAGDTDQQVLDFLVARYGEYILLKPRFSATTLILWITPAVALVGGTILAVATVRRRAAGGSGPELTADEERRLKRLMDEPPSA